MRRAGIAGLALAGVMVAFGTPARADEFGVKADGFLRKRDKDASQASSWVNVIVTVQGGVKQGNSDTLKGFGSIYQQLPLVDAVAVRIPVGRLRSLAHLPFVTHVSEDTAIQKSDEFTVNSSGAGAAFTQYGLTGAGIAVAVLDTGINSRPDLQSTRILGNVSFVPNDCSTNDANMHGTHVSGIIAGDGSMSTGTNYFRSFFGIARGANVVNVRVLDATGKGTVSGVLNAIDWVIANKSNYNIRVMNMSFGHPMADSYINDPLCQGVEKAWKAGIVVVCAAGNSGRLQDNVDPSLGNEGYGTNYGSIDSPGCDPYVITVGAMKQVDGVRAHDTIGTYSGRGPTKGDMILKPDLVAPGNRVISLRSPGTPIDDQYSSTNLIPFDYYRINGSDTDTKQYFRLSGTSMATPVVSGAAALLLQKYPSLSPDTIKARLMISADKWAFPNGKADPCTFGAGYINIPAALSCTVTANAPALSPKLVSDGLGNISLNQIIWGTNIIWGTGINNLQVIWGAQILWGTSTFANDIIIWGTAATSGDIIIWGTATAPDQVIWGTTTVSGSNVIWGASTVGDLNMTSIFGDLNDE